MALTKRQKLVLDELAVPSLDAERATGLPAQVSVAQAIIESAWLTVKPGNNCFGIKDTDRYPGCQYQKTKEFEDGSWKNCLLAFEVYPDLSACFIDHAKLLTSGYGHNVYSDVWEQYQLDHDLDKYILGVSKHYATDPGYAELVTTLVHGPNVNSAIERARKTGVVSVPVV